MNSRKKQKIEIEKLVEASHPYFMITGLPSSGKSVVAKSVFEIMDSDCFAWINCCECLNQRIIFERALLRWSGNNIKCDQSDLFVQEIKKLDLKRRFLILDNCEELLDLNIPSFFDFLLRLSNQISVILISHLRWEDIQCNISNNYVPPIVHFPKYNMDEACEIALLDCIDQENKPIYESLAKIVYGTISLSNSDLNLFRYVTNLLFPEYFEPIRNQDISREEASKLFGKIQPILKKYLNKLVLRDYSATEWRSISINQGFIKKGDLIGNVKIDMPFHTKFIVIAGFLASFNPKKYDARLFTKGGEGSKKVGKKGGVDNGSKMRSQLTGPKEFTVDRMLSIFHHVLDEDISPSFDIQSQVATCISLGLFLRVSAAGKLNGMKCKANISYPTIKKISNSINFDISKYLFDWTDN